MDHGCGNRFLVVIFIQQGGVAILGGNKLEWDQELAGNVAGVHRVSPHILSLYQTTVRLILDKG